MPKGQLEAIEFGRQLVETGDLDPVKWAQSKAFPGYLVSNTGLVKTTFKRSMAGKNGGLLRSSPDKDGYLTLGLWCVVRKKQITVGVAALVLDAFVGPKPTGMEACHNNSNVSDNRLKNLRWDTPKGNHADAVIRGTHSGFQKKGEANPFAKLTEAEVLEIRSKILQPEYQKHGSKVRLAKEYNISARNVADIVRRAIWRHV